MRCTPTQLEGDLKGDRGALIRPRNTRSNTCGISRGPLSGQGVVTSLQQAGYRIASGTQTQQGPRPRKAAPSSEQCTSDRHGRP